MATGNSRYLSDRGKQRVNSTQIFYPKAVHRSALKKFSAFVQKQFRKRAGIEGIIGHLKFDHRLDRNYLKGFAGDQINVLMAAAAFNFRKWLRVILFWLRIWLSVVMPQNTIEAVKI